jgi:uncharacterized protein (TIRG00374 family)
MSTPRGRRGLRFFLLVLGVAVLVAVFWKAGWEPVAENLSRVGWWLVVLVAIYVLPQAAFVEGWRTVLTPRPTSAFVSKLAGAYLAGDAVNYVGASVAGEPVRALLLRPEYSGASAFASINLRKHADLAGQTAFLGLGVLFSLAAFPLPAFLAAAAVLGAFVVGAGLALMTWGLRRGSYSPILRRLSRWKALSGLLSGFHEGATDVDDGIRRFYRENRRRFAASAGWSFLGWGGGLVETWLILRLLGVGSGWGTALAIEALTMALNTMLLFIPGRLGSAEAIRTGVFVALGLPAAAGAAYALVRRAREIVWILPGAVYLLRRHAGRWLRGGVAEGPPVRGPEASR